MKARWMLAAVALLAPLSGHAKVYYTLDEAQAALFPGVALERVDVTLTRDERKRIERAAHTRVRDASVDAWRTPEAAWFIVDRVLGKHDYITYAVALEPDGAVRRLIIMEYRESYGYEVRNERWRAQFAGVRAGDALNLGKQIHSISGATLSCKHLTDGIRRILATHELVLAQR